MSADQAFMDRIQRIRKGKTWVPDGVIVERPPRRKRRKSVNGRQKRVSFVLTLIVVAMFYGISRQALPELTAQFVAGDFSAVKALLEGIPTEKLEALPVLEGLTDGA